MWFSILTRKEMFSNNNVYFFQAGHLISLNAKFQRDLNFVPFLVTTLIPVVRTVGLNVLHGKANSGQN